MSVQTKTLKKLQSENILVDIFTDLFNESHYGFIRKSNDKFLLLEHYNSDGIYNGIIVFRTSDITRIKWDNNNLKSTLKILTKHDQLKNINKIKIESIENVLRSINNIYNHVNLSIQNIDKEMCIIGQIEEMDKKHIVVKEYGTRATLDRGMIMIAIEDITRIDAAGTYENGLLKVHKK